MGSARFFYLFIALDTSMLPAIIFFLGESPLGRAMSTEDLDALLERMPKIAEAVNAFNSEAVQQEAFSSLVAAFGGHHRKSHVLPPKPAEQNPALEEQQSEPQRGTETVSNPPPTSQQKRRKKGGGNSNGWSPVDIELHPENEQSFEDFIAEKQPTNDQERYAVVVYYLEETLKLNPITMNEIGTVFRRTNAWKEPTNLRSGLQNAAFRKLYIDVSNMSNIKITTAGRNFVRRELPHKASK